MQTIKCVALGDGSSGKTYAIQTFTTDIFPCEYVPTVFDNSSMQITIDGKVYNYEFSDTAGQEDYDRLQPLSYPNADVVMVVFSVASHFSLLNVEKKWVPEFRRHLGPDIPWVLVGCQSDLRDDLDSIERLNNQGRSFVTLGEINHLVKKLGAFKYIECSSKTRYNLEEVFITTIIAGLNKKDIDLGIGLDKSSYQLFKFRNIFGNKSTKNKGMKNVKYQDIKIEFNKNTNKEIRNEESAEEHDKLQENNIDQLVENKQAIFSDDGRYKNRFSEICKIGSGGFGNVFKVQNTFDEQMYVIKKIEFTEGNESIKTLTLKELKTMAKLQTDCVVHYKNSWIEYNNCLYIQMELCFDCLKNIIQIKAMAFDRKTDQTMNPLEYYISCEIFSGILQCVQYLHDLNPLLIHRDLKPANILITYNNTNHRFLKLCDFGLATVQDMESKEHTSGVGTVRYIAPEVIQGNKYDWRADIYSTGRIAQELFEIDIDESRKLPRYNSSIDKCMRELETQISSMLLSPFWRRRPTCAQVLTTCQDWTIDRNYVKECQEFESNVNQLKQNENQFFYKYFCNRFEINK